MATATDTTATESQASVADKQPTATDQTTTEDTSLIPKVKPWRKTTVLNREYLARLIEEVEGLKPMSEASISNYRLLLLGPVGSGKSSFCNTISSIFRGRITQRAACGNTTHSTTTAFTPYSVRNKTSGTLHFQLCDTRGLEEIFGPDILECTFLLDGHVPDLYEFNARKPISVKSPEFNLHPEPCNFIHCVAFVLDASTVDKIPEKILDRMKAFRELINQRRIPQVVILTKTDELVHDLNAGGNAEKVFIDEGVKAVVDKVSSLLGLQKNAIFPVKNYESEIDLDEAVDILALMALRQMLYLSEDCLENLMMSAATMKNSRGEVDGREGEPYKQSRKAGKKNKAVMDDYLSKCATIMDDFSSECA